MRHKNPTTSLVLFPTHPPPFNKCKSCKTKLINTRDIQNTTFCYFSECYQCKRKKTANGLSMGFWSEPEKCIKTEERNKNVTAKTTNTINKQIKFNK